MFDLFCFLLLLLLLLLFFISKSDDSDNDIVYSNNRKGSPKLNKKPTDYRSTSPPFNKRTTDFRSTSPPFGKKTTDFRSGSPPFNKKTTDFRSTSPPFNKKTTDFRSTSPTFNKKTTDFRSTSPSLNKKSSDFRSTLTSTKLPSLDLNKTKGKSFGNETYDESDDDDRTRSNMRPNISRSDYDTYDRDHSLNQTNSTALNGFNKKKKVIGASNQTTTTTTTNNNNNNTSIKKPNTNEIKSFRSSYETLPEEAPWSSSSIKTTKPDDISSRSFTKPTFSNDALKRTSPLINDIKPYSSGSTIKRDNFSDEDDDLYGKQKSKVIYL